MLLFVAVSGIGQTWDYNYTHSHFMAMLSTIHTSRNLKIGSLRSPVLRRLVLAMSVSFIVSTLLGVIMALKFAHNREMAVGCLVTGVWLPPAATLVNLHP
jgi:hypothetical protein